MALHIIDVIKYEGGNDTFVWKHGCEDFNNGSQLIVHETQEAVFFANGAIAATFARAGTRSIRRTTSSSRT